jgi:hypothetical protein
MSRRAVLVMPAALFVLGLPIAIGDWIVHSA